MSSNVKKTSIRPSLSLRSPISSALKDTAVLDTANRTNNLSLTSLGWGHFFQQQLILEEFTQLTPFRVTEVHRNRIVLQTVMEAPDGEMQLQEQNLSTLFWKDRPTQERPTVGDWLLLDADQQPIRLLNRFSLIQRLAAGIETNQQLIAANIDTLLIVTSCNQDFNLSRIERYLSLAAESRIQPVVVLTKSDLCESPERYIDQIRSLDNLLPVESVNATDPNSVKQLQPWCKSGQTLVLTGSSGVGKSTLVNSLSGQHEQDTQDIRENDAKGRHTTTGRSLHLISGGGLLLDTPGMRELKLFDSEFGIRKTFSEIETLAEQCRFADCLHLDEPDCAVTTAINDGRLEARRLESYHKLMSEQERSQQSVAAKREKDRALGRFYKSAKSSIKQHKGR
ncbi:ribosome biogenesis GTPase [Oceanospirillum multiglobuliferum]|uniref:ribosome small subunit-dependent GTPase A n=1 Tax=Oceanospirillum multiglobuliferum TaxID=64969 RepID=UPI00099B0468|nr:ribosome small subunit-dependent GTPase A [Oceanospirillum multiglobuliferum]SJZ95084.1 ribosome biogenesis GTPase [Oceanospirillum multiglobuliferum]